MWALWEAGDEVEGGEGEGGDVLCGCVRDGAGGEEGGPVGGGDGLHGLSVGDAEDAGRLVDLAGESGRVGGVWGGDGDVVELVSERGVLWRVCGDGLCRFSGERLIGHSASQHHKKNERRGQDDCEN